MSPAPQAVPDPAAFSTFAPILFFNLVSYICIGMPLALIPAFVTDTLGYGIVLAGAAVSLQYLASMSTRVLAGMLCDTKGPRRSVMLGLAISGASGVFLVLAGLGWQKPWLSLSLLVVARLLVGAAQSLIALGATTWSLGRTGPAAIGKVISWSGVCSYGGMAIGAPLGVLLERYLGWSAIGAATFALMTASLLLAMKKVDVPLLPGVKIGFYKVLASVTPYGLCLAAGATGYGVITAFIALFYASRGWPDPALAFTVMGISFVAARLLFGNAITRLGGFNVALISLTTEIAGLVLLWQASSPALALLGVTLVGFGFSQVFPAVGVEVVKLVPLSSRGAALGTYNLFMDMSLAIVGPLAGLVAGGFGYAAVFLASAVMVLIALAGVARLKVASRECR